MKRVTLLFLCILVFQQSSVSQNEQKKPAEGLASSTLSGLKLRSIGPALTSGRISAIAVDPSNASRYYVAAASGGVWKTVNAGTSFTPVFDSEASYSIGALAIDAKNPAVVWVGSGENNSQRSVSYGDGIYKSTDDGKSWQNMGLKKSEHLARILLDPRNSDIVYVAAQGPLWGPGGDRGLFKSIDGGKNWKAILSISEHTGVTDLVMDPRNPDILYAASYQRRRHVWTLIDGGPESAIHKSTDAGATWTRLKSGLPTVDMGRIGLAISPVDSRVVYATVEAAQKKGGFFRSTDYGATWEKRNDIIASSPQYYQTIVTDPKDVDRVYLMDVFIQVTDDGGKTFSRLGERAKHVDNHAMWIDPNDTKHSLVGCDGGLYESFDGGHTWDFKSNLSITQFYDVAVDNSLPFYYVYGGTQDNYSLGGPSRTRSASGIPNSDWFVTQGGDGFQSRVDPEDPNTVYAESQYGGLVRFDRKTGERLGIQPQVVVGEEPLRWNWDSPILISPHAHTRLYFAANKLYRSDDRGDTWKAVSGDLTRQIDRNKLPVMGKVWGADAVAKNASTSFYGNCTALSESPKKEGVLYVGTDDGLINISENGGAVWRRADKFPGVPDNTFVSRLLASQHDENTVYASFDNHKNADFAPYLMKSADAGKTWTSVKGDLPANGPVLAIAEDYQNSGLLFAGTEFGLFVSTNGGQRWIQLKGGLPTIAVRDLAIQKRENDLVLATFGRGFYVLDNYSPLRSLSTETVAKEAHLFAVKDALLYIEAQPLGGRGKSFQGESYFIADNPPFGASLTYYLKETLKTRKEKRQDAERDAEKKGTPSAYPTLEQLRAEDEEEAPAIILTVADPAGSVVRRLTGPAKSGIQRVAWDLRYPAPTLGQARPVDDEEGGAGPSGSLVMPGEYNVSIAKRVDGVITQLAGPVGFKVVIEGSNQMNPSDRAALVEFQQKVSRLQRAVTGASSLANDLKTRLTQIKRAIQETPAAVENLRNDAQALDGRLNDILRSLRGDNTARARNDNTPPSISQRVGDIVDNQRMSTAKPTQTDVAQYKIAGDDFSTELQKLRMLVSTDLPRLEQALERAGAPWTPGRLPEWKEN